VTSSVLGVPAPATVVGFAHHHASDGAPVWQQIPVQLDQRKVVDFGSAPGSNATAGVTGTVYGTAAIGVTALQYADANTFVGADSDPLIDADDELVFMSADAGDLRQTGDPVEPAGVVPGSGLRVDLTDSLAPRTAGYVYLFRSAGALAPGAGLDYVAYTFSLTSGAYKTTYKRADGPNAETSNVHTNNYDIGFTDRWIEDRWQIHAGTATGVDILDGNKNQFAINYCGRSNATFADAEGAFIANIDGPVRGIRSYVGANSGPLTQRTHLLSRDRERIVTNLRVHAIQAIMDYLDFSAAAIGMTYRSQSVPNGVTIDGTLDAVGTGYTSWEAVTGAQGSVISGSSFQTTINPPGGFLAAVTWFQRDQTTPPEAQCWGDSSFYGAAGPFIVPTGGIPDTDPLATPLTVTVAAA